MSIKKNKYPLGIGIYDLENNLALALRARGNLVITLS